MLWFDSLPARRSGYDHSPARLSVSLLSHHEIGELVSQQAGETSLVAVNLGGHATETPTRIELLGTVAERPSHGPIEGSVERWESQSSRSVMPRLTLV